MNILSHSIGCHFNCFFHCEEVFTFDIVSLDFFLLLFAFGVISKKNYCQGQCPGGSSLCFSLVVLWYQVFSYLSLEGKGGRKREDHWCVRETSIGWLALVCDGSQCTTQACALRGNPNGHIHLSSVSKLLVLCTPSCMGTADSHAAPLPYSSSSVLLLSPHSSPPLPPLSPQVFPSSYAPSTSWATGIV